METILSLASELNTIKEKLEKYEKFQEQRRVAMHKFYHTNKESAKRIYQKYYETNKERLKELDRIKKREKYQNDPAYRELSKERVRLSREKKRKMKEEMENKLIEENAEEVSNSESSPETKEV